MNLEVPERRASPPTCWPRDVDFFSVGTNDLIQYLLAVDRVDPRVSRYYQPLHPAVLRTMRQRRATRGAPRGLPVSVCGEMAADPLHGAGAAWASGVRELSMSPAAIPRVKAGVRAAAARRAARPAAPRCLAPAHRRRRGGGAASAAEHGPRPEPAASGRGYPRRSDDLSEIPKRVEKPWGYEIWWARTDRYVGKILHVKQGESLSLQYHNVKDETILHPVGAAALRDAPGRRGGRAAARWR